LWSDPLGEDSTKWLKSPSDWEEWLEMDFLPNPVRACGCFYGYTGIKVLRFLVGFDRDDNEQFATGILGEKQLDFVGSGS